MKQLRNDLFNLRVPIIILFIYWVVMNHIFGTICPLQAFIHLKCLACGLTRASINLYIGHFEKALEYNKTVFLWNGAILLFLFDRYLKKLKIAPFPILFILISIITIIVYLISMI